MHPTLVLIFQSYNHKMAFPFKSFLLLLLLGTIVETSIVPSTSTRSKCVGPDEPTKKTLIKVEDISYWDVDHDPTLPEEERESIKQEIVEELSSPLESHRIVSSPEEDICICPKLFGPVVCDQMGVPHSNICIFLCAQRMARCKGVDHLRPNKILARISPGDEGAQCKV